jgi:hypothetical protein
VDRQACAAGAKLLSGASARGVMLAPLCWKVPADVELSCEEAFGPVAVLARYSDFEAVLEEVNASRFGLQAGSSPMTCKVDACVGRARGGRSHHQMTCRPGVWITCELWRREGTPGSGGRVYGSRSKTLTEIRCWSSGIDGACCRVCQRIR